MAAVLAGIAALAAMPFLLGVAPLQGARTLAIDPEGSRVTIAVGRSGMLGFAGHDHEVLASAVKGQVQMDPADWSRSAVTLEFDATKLQVTGKGDPPADVPQVQAAMLSDHVLNVQRFPTMAFRSRRVAATPGASGIGLVIEGDFTMHGVTRPLTVRGTMSLDAAGVTARGTCAIKQTDFGMEPVSVAGGTVKVKDEVRVDFVLKAR